MGYQAPIALLVTINIILLTYGYLYRCQKAIGPDYSGLVLLIGDRDEFLEGLLRYFFCWCYRDSTYRQLQVIVKQPSEVTLAILHHFFVPYSYGGEIKTKAEMPVWSSYPAADNEFCYLDFRYEKDFQTALKRLHHVCRNKKE